MNPEATWSTVLVETVEREDTAGELLSHEDRRSAPAALDASPSARLAVRSLALARVLSERRPAFFRAARRFRHVGAKATLLLCALAVLIGSQAQWLATTGTRHFHILAPWLLFLLGANAVLGVLGLVAVLRRKSRAIPGLGRLVLELSARWELRAESPLALRALKSFRARWYELAGPVLASETRRTLHASSICMALGAMGSAAISGSLKRYEATVESTFFLPDQVHTFVTAVLSHPATLAGITLPQLPNGSTVVIGPAQPWLYAYATAFGLMVLAPRLLLIVLETARGWHERLALGRRVTPPRPATVIDLALASHTNIGKTSLARTLLANTVGEVRNAENVTTHREGYALLSAPDVELRVWDTPGFGDVEPARRYLRSGAWARLWQRWREQDEAASLARETMDALSDEADVVAYLVDAGEPPETAGYVGQELDLLAEAGAHCFVVLNQLEARTDEDHRTLEQTWSEHLDGLGHHLATISLDAHERCWLQEARLIHQIAELCRRERPSADRLMPAWQALQARRLHAATEAMARMLSAAASSRELKQRSEERSHAEQRLAVATQKYFAQATESIFDIYGVTGTAGQLIVNLLGTFVTRIVSRQDPTTRAFHGVLAGALSGMASGIAADVMAGGLTFGSGALVGAVIGAVGGTSASDGMHWFKTRDTEEIRWREEELQEMLKQLCELYLAVAHYGRARGAFRAEEAQSRSETWRPLIDAAVQLRWAQICEALGQREHFVGEQIRELLQDLLSQLWPRAAELVDFERFRRSHR